MEDKVGSARGNQRERSREIGTYCTCMNCSYESQCHLHCTIYYIFINTCIL